jgi:hypothetical protein
MHCSWRINDTVALKKIILFNKKRKSIIGFEKEIIILQLDVWVSTNCT